MAEVVRGEHLIWVYRCMTCMQRIRTHRPGYGLTPATFVCWLCGAGHFRRVTTIAKGSARYEWVDKGERMLVLLDKTGEVKWREIRAV